MTNPDLPINYQGLQKVDWVVGCTMLIDMKKFSKRIFLMKISFYSMKKMIYVKELNQMVDIFIVATN